MDRSSSSMRVPISSTNADESIDSNIRYERNEYKKS